MQLDHVVGGDGPPVLLVHGFASTKLFWEPLRPRLERHHTVLMPDLPLHGASPDIPDEVVPTPAVFVDALEAELDRHGWDAPHVVGHSYGGLLALELARRGRASTVTALSPSGETSDRARRQAKAILKGQRALGRALGPLVPRLARSSAVRLATMSASATRPWRMDPDWAAETAVEFLRTRRFDEIIDVLEPAPLVASFGRIEVPIVLAYGARDHIVPPSGASRYREVLPTTRTTVTILPGVGHAFTTDDPEATLSVILAGTRAAG